MSTKHQTQTKYEVWKGIRDKMNFPILSGFFAVAMTLHNLEEALWLPKWSQSAGRWHHPVGAREFRFAVGVLTALAYVSKRWRVLIRDGMSD